MPEGGRRNFKSGPRGFNSLHDLHIRRTRTCWLWQGPSDRFGRGRARHQGTLWYAPRLAWTLARGAIPRGMSVLHRCDTPACVRLSHLYLGTQQDNMRDRNERGRQARGSRHGSAKIDEATVRRILLSKKTQFELARDLRISQSMVSLIRARKRWRHVTMGY